MALGRWIDSPVGTAVAGGQGALGRCEAPTLVGPEHLVSLRVLSFPSEMESLLTAWAVRNSSREKCIAA